MIGGAGGVAPLGGVDPAGRLTGRRCNSILSAVQGRTWPRRAAPWPLLALFCEHVNHFDSTVIMGCLRTSNDGDGALMEKML